MFRRAEPRMPAKTQSTVPSNRAGQILRALVESFIRDGHPVGSRRLAKASGIDLSPATIRNVMADLEELGFIASPHTSAGRVPTARGYRLFVDTLVKLRPPASRELAALQDQIVDDAGADVKGLAAAASAALSSLTSLAGLVTIPRQQHLTLRQVEFLPISDRRVLAILVINDSEVQNRVLTMERDYSNDELQRAANFLNEHYAGKELSEIRSQVLDELRRTRETVNQLMIDTISIAQKAFDLDGSQPEYIIAGETKLMGFDELSDIDKLRQLFDAFNRQRDILRLLDRSIAADGVQIFIGEESGYQLLDDCSVVTAPYRVDDEIVGVLGVIGPTRMAYERVIPIVDITAKLVGAALNSSH